MAKGLEIRWSRKAILQVRKIAEYIEIDSPWQAERIAQLLYKLPESLIVNPKKGAIVPEFSDENIREIFLYNWRLVYRLRAGFIEVAAVVHGAQIMKISMLGKIDGYD